MVGEKVVYYGRNDCDGYFAVARQGSKLHCSCGRPLNKITATRWRCSAGWPEYDIAEGDMAFDKFGNIMLKAKPHTEDLTDETGSRGDTLERVERQGQERSVREGDVDQIRKKLGQEDSTIEVRGKKTRKV